MTQLGSIIFLLALGFVGYLFIQGLVFLVFFLTKHASRAIFYLRGYRPPRHR